PENHASRRVVEKLGFRDEGLRRRYLHIDGAWRDHLCYALTAEDVRGGLLARWRDTLSAQRSGTASLARAPLAGPAPRRSHDTPGRVLVIARAGPYRASREHARVTGAGACWAGPFGMP